MVRRSSFLIGSGFWFKVKRKYSAEELLELMKQNLGDKYGPLEVRGVLVKYVAVNGVQGYRILVAPGGDSMIGYSISFRHEEKMGAPPHTLGGCISGLASFIFLILTLGISQWSIWGYRKNRHIMIPLSEDIAKIVEGW